MGNMIVYPNITSDSSSKDYIFTGTPNHVFHPGRELESEAETNVVLDLDDVIISPPSCTIVSNITAIQIFVWRILYEWCEYLYK